MSAGAALEALLADPRGTGGVVLRSGPCPGRDLWISHLKAHLPPDTPLLRLPAGITPDRLLGGMDLGATLTTGRPVVRRGLLSEADGGILLVPMAERLPDHVVAALVEALDTGAIRLEREGASALHSARFVPVFLDESEEDEPGVAEALVDRVGPMVALEPRWRPGSQGSGVGDLRDFLGSPDGGVDPGESRGAVARPAPAPPATLLDGAEHAVVEAAAALGIPSLRPTLRTLSVARALARARGMEEVDAELLGEAAGLVLAPRARVMPAAPEEPPPPPPDAPPPEETPEESGAGESGTLADRVLDAVRPSLPQGLLSSLAVAEAARNAAASAGRSGEERRQPRHGRAAGARPGDPRRGGKVDLLATLRAAAPWQAIRRGAEEAAAVGGAAAPPGRLRISRDDFRIRVLVRKASTTAIFVVDASGSQALNRLAEAKGAVELLLAESYVRRDSVALVAFRGTGAEVVLPPTRALARARRALAGLPGGGGTPLASGVEAGFVLAERVRREGAAPVLVILTDGRANVGRDGKGGREQADADARAACRAVRVAGIPALFVDSSPRGAPVARELASLMGARYLRLPSSDPGVLSGAVRAAGGDR